MAGDEVASGGAEKVEGVVSVLARPRHRFRLWMASRIAAVIMTATPPVISQKVQLSEYCNPPTSSAMLKSEALKTHAREPINDIGPPLPPLPQRAVPRHFGCNASIRDQHATTAKKAAPIKYSVGLDGFPLLCGLARRKKQSTRPFTPLPWFMISIVFSTPPYFKPIQRSEGVARILRRQKHYAEQGMPSWRTCCGSLLSLPSPPRRRRGRSSGGRVTQGGARSSLTLGYNHVIPTGFQFGATHIRFLFFLINRRPVTIRNMPTEKIQKKCSKRDPAESLVASAPNAATRDTAPSSAMIFPRNVPASFTSTRTVLAHTACMTDHRDSSCFMAVLKAESGPRVFEMDEDRKCPCKKVEGL